MQENRTIKGYTFDLVSQNDGDDKFYHCRGDVHYDDDHDEQPEPGLWLAAMQLESELIIEGYKADAGYSEKGWCEVTLLKD
jgi:hypothetical protein